jgi:sporulation protein YlmC with PRC-barrel domain
MEEAEHRPDNPYTEIEGYTARDASGVEVGKVEETVYDAPSGVLKYVSIDGRAVPADRLDVNPEDESVRLPYDRSLLDSAPALQEPSGEFEDTLRRHYGEG